MVSTLLSLKPAYFVVGIILVLIGAFFLLFAHEIWRLYYDGPETCSPLPGNGPTCASIDAEIYELAITGIILLVVSGIVFFLGRRKPAQKQSGNSPNTGPLP